MKNVKLTRTVNIEIGDYRLSLSEDEAFELYGALAKKFGPLGDDDYMDDEDEIEEDEDDGPSAEAEHVKFLEDLRKELNKGKNAGNPYPTWPTHPRPVEWPSHPHDFPKFPQVWCTQTTKHTIK